MPRHHHLVILLICCAAGFIGWLLWMRSDASAGRAESPGIQAGPAPVTTHPAAWHLPPDQRERLVIAANQINLADPKADVLAALGTPDSDRVLVPKGIGLKPHGSSVKYYVVRYEDGLVNEKWDQSISFDFDVDGRLRYVFSNVADVPTKGEMIRRLP
jgi:hypothetical protein